MRKISKEELSEILEKHKKWLNNEGGGEKADLRKANLSGADLRGIDLRQADLRETDLSGADLQGTDLRYASLYCADLSSSDLRYASLYRADLSGSDLRYASLLGANLLGANLRGSDLHYADLRCVDLRKVDLSAAILLSANLRGAKMQDARLDCTIRSWLIYVGPIGSRRSKTLYFADYDNIQCGCWKKYKGGTLAEFKERINEVYPAGGKNECCQQCRFEYLLAIKMFENMREAYLQSVKKNNE